MSCGRNVTLNPLSLLIILVPATLMLGFGGLAFAGEWLVNHNDNGSGKIGLAMLAFAALCGFVGFKGLRVHWKHRRF